MASALCALLPLASARIAGAPWETTPAPARSHRLGAPAVRVAAQTSNEPDERPAGGAAGLGPGGGIERVMLRFEGSVPASVIALAESDLRTAFGRRGVEVVRREPGTRPPGRPAATGVVLTIAIASERLEQVALTLEEATPPSRESAAEHAAGATATSSPPAAAPGGPGAAIGFTLVRRLNLTAFPADGRMLALVVAADEMLVAAGTEHARRAGGRSPGGVEAPLPAPVQAQATPPETPARNAIGAAPQEAPGPPAPAEAAVEAKPGGGRAEPAPKEDRAAPLSWPENGLAAMAALERFGGGQTHLGVDLGWRRRVGGRWIASVAAQGRQGRTVTTGTGTIDSRWVGGRLAFGLTLADDGGRLWLTADAGARAGWLRFEGRGTAPDGRPLGHQVDSFASYVDATLTLDVRLGGSPLALRLSAGAGLPLLAQDAASGDTVVTGASGPAFESEAGLVVNF